MIQTNYAGVGSYNTQLFSIDNQSATIALDVDDHSAVVNYNPNGSVQCDLSVPGVTDCTIDYQITVSNIAMNGTLGISEQGSYKYQSECNLLADKYDASNTAS